MPGEDIRPLQSKPIYKDSYTSCFSSSSFILMTESFHYYQENMEALPAHALHMKPHFMHLDLRWKYRSRSSYIHGKYTSRSLRKLSSGYCYSECALLRHQLCLLYFSVRVSDSRPLSTWFSLEREAANHVRLPAHFSHRPPLGILAKIHFTTTTTTTTTDMCIHTMPVFSSISYVHHSIQIGCRDLVQSVSQLKYYL